MLSELRLRGPDDEGVFIDGAVHLGHTRLSIIDLSDKAHQPMSNEDGSVWLSYNGEVYNFKSLREGLLKQGHVFRSHTDSEVVIHLYEEKGVDAFELLNGMFAFALWDKGRQLLFLVRDKMGQKPLYYAGVNGVFLFASESRSLARHPAFQKRLNLPSLAKYLFYEHVPAPDCIWEDAYQLPPSSYLAYDAKTGSCSIKHYWKLRYLPRENMPEEECLRALDEKLGAAVERHLTADVPVGVYLSGGIDSSTVAYYAQKAVNGKLKTFTVSFNEDTFAEQDRAATTARYLGTQHHQIDFSCEDFIATAFQAVPRLDAPFADSSFIPSFYLNKFARERIKVALGGEGGDELFVGYPIYMAHQALDYLRHIPPFVRRFFLRPLVSALPSSYKNETWEYRMKKFFEAERYFSNPFYCQQIWLGAFGPELLPRLFRKEYHERIRLDALFENIDYYRRDADEGEGIIAGLMRQTQAKYLMDDGLAKTDRASMMNSLECRAPFLDNEVVEWVNRIPFERKYKAGTTKLLLRRLMKGRIPDEIFSGPKRGFTPPIAEWFVNSFPDRIRDVLLAEDEYFNRDFIERIWKEHTRRKHNHRKLLWTLFIWRLWSEHNLK